MDENYENDIDRSNINENESEDEEQEQEQEQEQETGVRINLISSRKLDSMSSQEKLRFILDQVKRGTVLVLERGLTAVEEIDLIKATMSEIDHQTFIGIEMQSYSSDDVVAGSWFSKLLGRTKVPRMSVIGPANLLKTIQKDGNMIQAMILTGKSILGNPQKAKNKKRVDESVDRDYEESETEIDSEGERPPLAKPVDVENEDGFETETETENENETETKTEPEDQSTDENEDEYKVENEDNNSEIVSETKGGQDWYGEHPASVNTREETEKSIYEKSLELSQRSYLNEIYNNDKNDIENGAGSNFLYRRLKSYEEE